MWSGYVNILRFEGIDKVKNLQLGLDNLQLLIRVPIHGNRKLHQLKPAVHYSEQMNQAAHAG
jgi:hypothetical protein